MMRRNNFILQCNNAGPKTAMCLSWLRLLAHQPTVDVMLPVLLSKVLSALWRTLRSPPGAPGGIRRRQQVRQPRPPGRRRARRLHLGRARPAAGGRADRHRRHLRRLGRRRERGDARRRACARRRRGGAAAARRLLARGELRRRPAGAAARSDRTAVRIRAAAELAGAVAWRAVALLVALRSQSAQHQSAQEPDRALCRFRAGARRCGPGAVHFRHQRRHRRAARVLAR